MKKFLNNMINEVKSSSNVVIMTHRHMDLDGFGSALGLYEVILKYNKNVSIITNREEMDSSISKSVEKLDVNKYDFINEEQLFSKINENSLILILDVHKKEMLEVPDVVDQNYKIIIIDHHIVGNNPIDNTVFTYIKPGTSSTVEIVTQILEEENVKIDSIVATIMLAGMYIDTNNFNLKTTKDTYLSGAFLMENGADNVMKQEIFQENRKSFIERQNLLKHSYMINDNMIICVLDKTIYTGVDLAKISDELLQIEEVDASFTIGFVDENIIGISARSLGIINVEKIMNKFGGGGHKTDAAARIETTDIKEIKNKLETILK